MSAKSTIKLLVPANRESSLFKWVAVLTGSKNALKGAGFFLGGLLLAALGYRTLALRDGGGARRRPGRHDGVAARASSASRRRKSQVQGAPLQDARR